MKSKSKLIFGVHPVAEAVESGKTIEKIFIRQDIKNSLVPGLIQNMQLKKIPFQFVPAQKLNKMTGGNHQGVIARLSEIEYTEMDKLIPILFEQGKLPVVIILDGITDVRNFGAIARSAVCSGIDAMIIPAKGSAQINAEAVKASSGALHSIPVCRVKRLVDAAVFLKESGMQLVAAHERAPDLIYSVDFTGPSGLILGAEDTGIERELLQMADKTARIPVFGNIQSLNVSVAASVLFYEMVRQREYS